MLDTVLHQTTADQLGIPLVTEAEINTALRERANLPGIPEFIPGANRLLADLIDIAATVDTQVDREKARDAMRARLVRETEGRSVHYAAIEFEPEMHGTDAHAVCYYSHLPGKGHDPVKIVPLLYAGPEYLRRTGERWISGGTFQCILFKPLNEGGAYKALPIGFAHTSAIATWNEIVRRHNELPAFADKQWVLITPIPNDLRRPGVRRIAFIPRFDPHTKLVSGHKRRQKLGRHFGQTVYLAPRAEAPELDIQDEKKGFFRPHLFRIKRLWEEGIEVVWLGPEEEVHIEDRMEMEGMRAEMNPFAVLNVIPLYVDWRSVDRLTRKWLNRPYNESNPLFLAGKELGLIYARDDRVTVRAILEDLWKRANEEIQLQMLAACDQTVRMLGAVLSKPSARDLLGSAKSVHQLINTLNTPEDAAANWIGKNLAATFDPKSPFHRYLRTWLINSYPPSIFVSPLQQTFAQNLTPTPTMALKPLPTPMEPTRAITFQPKEGFKPIPDGTPVVPDQFVEELDDEHSAAFPEDTEFAFPSSVPPTDQHQLQIPQLTIPTLKL